MIADLASILINAPAETVFDYIRDPAKMDRWSFGTWQTQIHADGLIEGLALGSGGLTYLRIDADRSRMIVDYHLGETADALSPRIFARVIPGAVTGHGTVSSLLLLTALRGASMDDARWAGLCRAHAAELDLIKSQIETGYDPRA